MRSPSKMTGRLLISALLMILSRIQVQGASVALPFDSVAAAQTLSGDDAVLLSATGSLSTVTLDRAQSSSSTLPTPTNYTNSDAEKTSSNCYFPSEYQGIYQVQSAIDPLGRVQYDEVEIGPQDVSVWGTCHSLFGQHVLLHISTESGDCFRCFHVQMRTPSILQVNTEGLEKCYTNEQTARSKCPSAAAIRPGDGIILWRKSGSIEPPRSASGQNTYRALCPLDGEFTFTYYLNGSPLCETGSVEDGANGQSVGSHVISARNAPNNEPTDFQPPLSIISNCPSRDILHATFRSCSFTDRETTFKCLGTWPGEEGQSYVGLMDYYDDSYAKFRCAIYKEQKVSRMVKGVPTEMTVFHVSLSPDSTCTTELYNATYGFETLELYPIKKFSKSKVKQKLRELKDKSQAGNATAPSTEDSTSTGKPLARMLFAAGKGSPIPKLPKKLVEEDDNITCQFPEWIQGDWQYFSAKGDDLFMNTTTVDYVFASGQDHSVCVASEAAASPDEEKFILFSKSSCGEETMTCLWVRKKQSGGMMEFKTGLPVPIHESILLKPVVSSSSDLANQPYPPFEICDESYFYGSPWVTQLKLNFVEAPLSYSSGCPFMGELEAEIGQGEKCAALSTHCGTPDIFDYKLRTCKSGSRYPSYGSQIYDERHYRCLSSWNENGFTFLMTEKLKGGALDVVPDYNIIKAREAKPAAASDNLETQCFVMKQISQDGSYVVASLSSNCRHAASQESSWDEFLTQNGLRFRLKANCSTNPSNSLENNEISISDYPGGRYRAGGRKDFVGQTNDTAENFNSIYSTLSSGSERRNVTLLYFSTVILAFCFVATSLCRIS